MTQETFVVQGFNKTIIPREAGIPHVIKCPGIYFMASTTAGLAEHMDGLFKAKKTTIERDTSQCPFLQFLQVEWIHGFGFCDCIYAGEIRKISGESNDLIG